MVSHDQIITDRFARGLIRRRVRQFVGRAGFTNQDTRELEQELLLRLMDGLRNYNADRTQHLNVFITRSVRFGQGCEVAEIGPAPAGHYPAESGA